MKNSGPGTRKSNIAFDDLPEVFAYADQTCRAVAEEMAISGVVSIPVIDRETGAVCGSISAHDLLVGRRRAVARESERSTPFRPDPRKEPVNS